MNRDDLAWHKGAWYYQAENGVWHIYTENQFEPEQLKADNARLEADNARLKADNARLRALLKEVETINFYDESYRCAFCEREYDGGPVHDLDCRAFTPEGEVK